MHFKLCQSRFTSKTCIAKCFKGYISSFHVLTIIRNVIKLSNNVSSSSILITVAVNVFHECLLVGIIATLFEQNMNIILTSICLNGITLNCSKMFEARTLKRLYIPRVCLKMCRCVYLDYSTTLASY